MGRGLRASGVLRGISVIPKSVHDDRMRDNLDALRFPAFGGGDGCDEAARQGRAHDREV